MRTEAAPRTRLQSEPFCAAQRSCNQRSADLSAVPAQAGNPVRLVSSWFGMAALLLAPAMGWAATTGPIQSEAHGLPLHAEDVAHIGGFPITNSMVVTWLVALFLILLARLATRKMQAVPDGLQNLWEWMVEGLFEFLEGIIGGPLAQKTFWFFATIFIFILSLNWSGLIPGVGTIGWGNYGEHGFEVTKPFLRGANADLNMTLAMAMIFFACWLVWALQANGLKGFLLHLFGPKGDMTGALRVLMMFVFAAIGILEVISILFRPISLSFRLYGNVFAGENMLEAMAKLVPALSWLLPIPFYFMEILVGLAQALVFMLLTAVFTLLICMHEEDAGHAPH